jgi:hypothetical protein
MPVAADITTVFPNATPTTLATKADSTDEAPEEEIDATKADSTDEALEELMLPK